MKRLKNAVAALVAATVAVWLMAAGTIAFAEEPEDMSGEAEAVAAEGATAQEEVTAQENEDDAQESEGMSLYAAGRKWAEENPEVFSAVATVIGVAAYALVQLIGWLKMKRPMILSSNNAVDICRKTEADMEHLLNDNRQRVDGICKSMVAAVEDARVRTQATLQEVKGLAEHVRSEASGLTEEREREREAILLLAQVVSRLLEESSLPARTRDEIHRLSFEAEKRLKEVERHEKAEETDVAE